MVLNKWIAKIIIIISELFLYPKVVNPKEKKIKKFGIFYKHFKFTFMQGNFTSILLPLN